MNKIIQRKDIFDGVRGFAFLIVLVMHGFSLCYDDAVIYLQGCGKYGVWLFFVLSSFLLTRNYLMQDGNKLNYIISRTIRIVPLYLIACACYLYFEVTIPDDADWANILLIRYGPNHLWTVPVEFYFYIFLLLLWLLPISFARHSIFLILSACSVALLFNAPKEPNSINTFWYLPSFFSGYVLAITWDRIPVISHGTGISLSILMIFFLISPGVTHFLLNIQPSPYLMNMYTPLSVAWGIFIIAACKSPHSIVNRILSSKLFCHLGYISYSGYLFHWLIMIKLKQLLGSGISTVALALFTSVLAALIIYKLIEVPFHGLKTLLTNKLISVN